MQKSIKKPFIKLEGECKIMDDLLELIQEEEAFVMYRKWWTRPVPDEVIDKDPFLSFLRHTLESRFGIMRLAPHFAYKWHVDVKRQGTMNMLIKHDHSLSMFSPTLELDAPFMVVPYEIGKFYLFDVQEPHQVINFNGFRYVLTTEIYGEHKDKRIHELKEIIDELYNC